MDSLPVYGPGHELLYNAPLSTVPRLIKSGRVREVGSRRRVRALVAICGIEELRMARPHTGERFSDKRETPDNPRGVWHFNYKSYAAA